VVVEVIAVLETGRDIAAGGIGWAGEDHEAAGAFVDRAEVAESGRGGDVVNGNGECSGVGVNAVFIFEADDDGAGGRAIGVGVGLGAGGAVDIQRRAVAPV